jgi:hypothetical protein
MMFCLLLIFCGAEDWIQGLMHARQVTDHWAPTPWNFLI